MFPVLRIARAGVASATPRATKTGLRAATPAPWLQLPGSTLQVVAMRDFNNDNWWSF